MNRLRHLVFLGFGAWLAAGLVHANTLDDVRARDELNCGINAGLVGFAAIDANGEWQGFDVSICKVIAAAVLGDPSKVNYIPTTAQTRFTSLRAGEVDLLSRNTTWTFSNDTDLKLDFAGINYYDGQGFLVRREQGISSATELDGYSICIRAGTTSELNLADYFRTHGMGFKAVSIGSNAEGQQKYISGECSAYSSDISSLAATRATFENPDAHVILPEIISKEPLGPAVRHGDDEWADIIRWSLYALIAAEEFGVTSANVMTIAEETSDPEIRRLLGFEGRLGEWLGLDESWAKRVIAVEGNYGEIFERHIGSSTPVGLARGLNAQWSEGGLMYAPPFR